MQTRPKILVLSLALAMSLPFPVIAEDSNNNQDSVELESLTVTASADASAEGLASEFAGGQVAEGGRAGILGTKDHLDTPFSITSYTNEFIQDRQAQSVGDVLKADPSVRVARGFGNFQESYFIRGFILSSDDVAYNGLYSLLPRQYIATELFERVEVLRGASAFLTGANPNGGGIGGAINLLPKRAPNYDLNRVTLGASHNNKRNIAADVARRFGESDEFGVRVNAAHHNGGTSIDDEQAELNLFNIGLDYQGDRLRLSADMGYQNHQLDETRTNVTLVNLTQVPSAPDASKNWAQPWTYSNEKDKFGTFRAEYDLNDDVTVWGAYGLRRTDEENSLANIRVLNAESGEANMGRFDNTREERVDTGEIGFRGTFNTGSIGHDWVVAYSYFQSEKKNAYIGEFGAGRFSTNLYNPSDVAKPDFLGPGAGTGTFAGNDLDSPALNGRTKFNSFAIGDTLSFMDDQFLLTLGARHQAIKVDDYPYGGVARSSYEDSEITPAIGAVAKVTDKFSVYANYIESLTKGETAPSTASGIAISNVGESLAPYVSEQKEVGLKYETNELGFGLAYFTTTKPRAVVENAIFKESGEDDHQGVELTVYGKATDDVKLLGGVTWIDAEQKDTGDASLDGNDVIGVAEFQANIGAEWEVPQVDGLALDTQLTYTGSRYADAANTLKVDDWTTVDIGARYIVAIGNQDLTLRARVNNLFDRDYWSSVGGFPNNGYLVLGAPRTVSLTATVDFY